MRLSGHRGRVGLGFGGGSGHGRGSGRRGTGLEGPEGGVLHGRSRSTRGAEQEHRVPNRFVERLQRQDVVSRTIYGGYIWSVRAPRSVGTHTRLSLRANPRCPHTARLLCCILNPSVTGHHSRYCHNPNLDITRCHSASRWDRSMACRPSTPAASSQVGRSWPVHFTYWSFRQRPNMRESKMSTWYSSPSATSSGGGGGWRWPGNGSPAVYSNRGTWSTGWICIAAGRRGRPQLRKVQIGGGRSCEMGGG